MKLLEAIQKNLKKEILLDAHFGLEREALRVTQTGKLVETPHPATLWNKLKNPYITTDFSESQIEMITPAYPSLEEAHHFLEALYDIVAMEIGDELLWPQSMPCGLDDNMEIKVADFKEYGEQGERATAYREYLAEKYGSKKQLISGIHFNFSLSDHLLQKLYDSLGEGESFSVFKDNVYLKIARNYLRYRWLLVYIVGNTPVMHTSYPQGKCRKHVKMMSEDALALPHSISFRSSSCGYDNKTPLYSNYQSVEEYVKSIEAFMQQGIIQSHKEVYSQVRLKPKDTDNFLESLRKDGIQYIEIRSIDINPYEKAGVSLQELKMIHLFLLFCLIEEEGEYQEWQEEGLANQRDIAREGLNGINLSREGVAISKEKWAKELLDKIRAMHDTLNLGMGEVIETFYQYALKREGLSAGRLRTQIEQKGYTNTHIELAKQYKQEAYNNRFKLRGDEELELSTQILMREAIKQGIKIDIIDRSENFIALSKDGHKQYVKQATKTGIDSYITFLMMENKVVTKKILEDYGVEVPRGVEFNSLQEWQKYKEYFVDQGVVVKPKSTNFGLGISIFTEGATDEDLDKAIALALTHDKTVIVEEFIAGKEYRFLVLGDEVAGILHRVPANVIGDGEHTIAELIKVKNKDPLRGKGYRTPLEKIPMDSQSELFLKQSGRSFDTVPKSEEVVYLRENSNISTGGDSIDYTDAIDERFKVIAVQAAKAVGAKICGVDMMIRDYRDKESSYSIIELNFNPAIHIHSFPYKGKERNIAQKVLQLLEL